MDSSHGRLLRAAIFLIFVLSGPVATEAEEPISSIRIDSAPVFPDTTDVPIPWILRLANRIHVTTREDVIRGEILIREEEPFDSLRISESERLLRRRGIFEEVELNTFPGDSGRVVLVETQDLWTLSVQLSLEKQADLSSLTFGLEESNFLGTGNEISWTQIVSTDQDGVLASIRLPRLASTRAGLSLFYTDLDDATVRSGFLGRLPESPFDRIGWGIRVLGHRGRQRFFHDGEEVGVSRFERETASFFVGRYTGRDLQIGAGLGWAERRLRPLGEPRATEPGFHPPPAYTEAWFRGPLLYVGAMRRAFLEAKNLDRYGTIEDLPVGWSALLTLGPNILHHEDPSRAFSARSVLAGSWFRTPRFGVSLACVAEGFLNRKPRLSERKLSATGAAIWHPNESWLTALQGSMILGADRPETAVFNLGTGAGLRGYPTRAFETRDALLATFETRYWTGLEVLWTGIGLNAFSDTALPTHGSWHQGEKWRTGVGCGILLGLKKSLRRPVRIEVAWRTDETADPTLTLSMSSSIRAVPSIFFPDPTLDFANAAR